MEKYLRRQMEEGVDAEEVGAEEIQKIENAEDEAENEEDSEVATENGESKEDETQDDTVVKNGSENDNNQKDFIVGWDEDSIPKDETAGHTITEFAEQEIGNWMNEKPVILGDTPVQDSPPVPPKESAPTKHATYTDLTTEEEGNAGASFTEFAEQELGNMMGDGKSSQNDNNATPKDEAKENAPDEEEPEEKEEMDIPQTEEEEEEVNEEIEEWEEEHGKGNIPQTVEDEEEKKKDQSKDNENKNNERPPLDNQEEVHEVVKETVEEDSNNLNLDAVGKDEVPAESPTTNPLVVSPSWTPPKVPKKHQLATRSPTMAPKPVVAKEHQGIKEHQGMDVPDNMEACQEFGTGTAAYLLCKNNIPPFYVSLAGAGLLLAFLFCCCCKFCCRKSKKADETRGKYRQIANTYGDPSYDNAFSADYSDDEDDLEDATWGQSNGRKVLEMKDLGRRGGGLSLEEMNG